MLVDNFLNKKEKITILNLQKRNLTINLGQVYSNANLLDDKQMSQFILFIYKFVCLFWREREREGGSHGAYVKTNKEWLWFDWYWFGLDD